MTIVSSRDKKICIQEFKSKIWKFYNEKGKRLPWRNTSDPYKILVSEIMLQQTQVDRVLLFYNRFIKKYPSIQALSQANLPDILLSWQGLGYNKRAINLLKTARIIIRDHQGIIPLSIDKLDNLPGIGSYTARATIVFSINTPLVFIETNIRSVFIFFFFRDSIRVSDSEITPLIEDTLDIQNPREWYWALMDYGSMLKKSYHGINQKSAHYLKQSVFKGSQRELRSNILKLLLKRKKASEQELSISLHKKSTDVCLILKTLTKERLIQKKGDIYMIGHI